MFIKDNFIIYGIDNKDKVINKIIINVNDNKIKFDIKLMLTEAINNAYLHGNSRDSNKPIFIYYEQNNDYVYIEIKDCGTGFEDIKVPNELSTENILNSCGRGLYLIKCVADKLKIKNNVLKIKKNLIK
jgi:serine/threonine-protein kinase RsbW